MAALATGVSQAHDEDYCEGGDDYDHYIEDINEGPPDRYLLYVSSQHPDVVIKPGIGVSRISVVRRDSNSFDYVGHDVEVTKGYVFEIYYTTDRVEAVLWLCFEIDLGFWYPIPLHGNSPPHTKNLPIPRQDLEITGGPRTIDLSHYFADYDNDNLTYTAVSSDANVATVSVAGSTLTISPGEETGVADVNLTVADGIDSIGGSIRVVVYQPPEIRTTTEMSGIVDPNAKTEVESKDGSLTVTFPVGSMMSNYYQARIDPDSDDCGTEAPANNEYLCLSVDLFDLAATAIDENLSQNGRMVLTLDQTQATAVQTAITGETFSLYRGDGTANSWTEIMECSDPVGTSECYTFTTTGSGGTIEVVNISGFSDFTTSITRI